MGAVQMRSGVRFWVAWVAVAAIGAAAAALISVYVFNSAPPRVTGTFVLALPVVALQYLVLKLAGGVPANGAGWWAALSLIAAVATAEIDSVWVVTIAPAHFPSVTNLVPSLSSPSFTLGALRIIDPLVLGIAQGIALARIFGKTRVAIVWTVASVIASIIAQQFLVSVVIQLPIPGIPFVLPILIINVAFALVFSALTGALLVAMFRNRPVWLFGLPATGREPAVRSSQAPTP
jgi:hypothetical protein